MTADNWEPSEEMKATVDTAFWEFEIGKHASDDGTAWAHVLKAVRDLIIAEVRPQIEAAERERVLEEAAKLCEEKDTASKQIPLKPTIAELELLLNTEGPPVTILPDGTVFASESKFIKLAAEIRALKDSKP